MLPGMGRKVWYSSKVALLAGGIRIFGFAVSAIFAIGFPVFVPKKLRNFGFGGYCGLRFLFYFALGFRFSGKITTGFRICYSMLFGVFPVSLRKICASTTSTTWASPRILFAVFGFDRTLFRFCGFLTHFWFAMHHFWFAMQTRKDVCKLKVTCCVRTLGNLCLSLSLHRILSAD